MSEKLNPRDVKIIKEINGMPQKKGLKRAREIRQHLNDRFTSTFDTGPRFKRDVAFSKAIDSAVARLSRK